MAMHQRHTTLLSSQAVLSADTLRATEITLHNLERFWSRSADLMQRPHATEADQPNPAELRADLVGHSRQVRLDP